MSRFPGNLTRQARTDLRRELRRSREGFGDEVALRLGAGLLARFRQIAEGQAVGRRRSDLPFDQPTLCLTFKPLLIFSNPRTHIVLRIVDGRRDLRALILE